MPLTRTAGPKRNTGGRGRDGRGKPTRGGKDRDREGTRGRRFFRKKVCKYCVEKVEHIDYKDTVRLLKFVTEKGKIVPRRISGNCAWHRASMSRQDIGLRQPQALDVRRPEPALVRGGATVTKTLLRNYKQDIS